MYNMFHVLLNWIATIFISLIITPLIKKLSFKIGAVDKPSKRRMNDKIMPTMGGLVIYISTFLSLFFLQPIDNTYVIPLFIASTIIILTGIVDDIREIKPILKLIGIFVAALIIYYMANIRVDVLKVPLLGTFEFGWMSLPITILWIVGITNSINLIDGLDGLANGVSIIALTTMGIIGYFFLSFNNIIITIFVFTIVSAAIGFLPYNFFPASIYLGDTGALFLGFIISVVSLQGLKNATFVSFIIPIIALGVPITDTFFAIIRRVLNKTSISAADKNHMHHKLLQLGMTHRQAVLFLYGVALTFSIIALLVPISSSISLVLLISALILGILFFVEMIDLVGMNHKPLTNFVKNFIKKVNRKS